MRHLEFPFSHYRPHVDTPEVAPKIDMESLMSLDRFLEKNRLVVLDDVAYSYRYGGQKYGATITNLRNYIGYTKLRSFFTENVIANPDAPVSDVLLELEDRAREVGHRAKNLEVNLGMFYGLALMRHRALTNTLKSINNRQSPEAIYTAHSSDAIIDFGQSMLYPKTIPAPTARNRKYEEEDARAIQKFGMYAYEVDRDILASTSGVQVVHVVKNEQQRRIRTFEPRYRALLSFVGTQIPSQVIHPDMSDEQLLDISFVDPDSVE